MKIKDFIDNGLTDYQRTIGLNRDYDIPGRIIILT